MFSGSKNPRTSRISSIELLSSRPRSSSIGLSSRDSYGNLLSRRASSEERKSGNGSNRRFSGVGNSSANEVKCLKDTRPLNDKVYQKRKVAEIVEFLEEKNYKPSITPTKLMQPSKKEFEMIFKFLVNMFEPSFEIKNFEEDAPTFLKNLGYPFVPNKSAFHYVARTSFSSLLGILIYLMDIAKFSENIDVSKVYMSGDCERPEEHAIVSNYIFECLRSDNNNEEEAAQVFEQIIRARPGGNLDEIQEKNTIKKERLKQIKDELDEMEQLQNSCNELDSHFKKYEEYFAGMEKRKEIKETAISKLLEVLQNKRSQLEELEKKLAEKQAIYDAQGFDGVKHRSHYEEQKKELNELLELKKAKLKELQEECWDLELQHSTLLEKIEELFNCFKRNYNQINDAAQSVLKIIQTIPNPEMLNVANNLKKVLQDSPLQISEKNLLMCINTHKEKLEEIQKKIDTTNVILKTFLSAKLEELTEIKMKKLQLSTKLKCASSDEAKKEQALFTIEKQAIEEIKVLEQRVDEELKKLDQLRKENKKKMEYVEKLEADLKEVQKMKITQTSMLEEYLKQQKKYFDKLAVIAETVAKEVEERGEEIVLTLENLTKEEDK